MNSSHYRRRFGKALLHIGCFFVLLVACEDCWKKKPLQAPPKTVINTGNMPNGDNMCYLNSVMQIIARLYPDMFEGHSDEQAVAGQAIVEKIKLNECAIKDGEEEQLYSAFLEEEKKRLEEAKKELRAKNEREGIREGKELFPRFKKGRHEDAAEAFSTLFVKYIFDTEKKVSEKKDQKKRQLQIKQYPYTVRVKEEIGIQDKKFSLLENNLAEPLISPIAISFGGSLQERTMQDHFEQHLFAEEQLDEDNAFTHQTHGPFSSKKEGENKKNALKKKYPGYIVEDYTPETGDNEGKKILQVKGIIKMFNKVGNLNALHNNLLVIQMKRFDSSSKIETPVKKPFHLKIEAENTVENEAKSYDLVGFIVHRGSVNGGHYTAYVKQYGQWRHYDALQDPKVFLINDQDAEKAAEEAYLYFYKAA